MWRCAIGACLLAGCEEPGLVWFGPEASPLRTALYRVAPRDGSAEIVILLSNGELGCGLPDLSDPNEQSEAAEALYAAACREGARHVVLKLYSWDGAWLGAFPGHPTAGPAQLSAAQPKLSTGAFFAVQEAALLDLRGQDRVYSIEQYVFLPDLGLQGQVELEAEPSDRPLDGWFSFPTEDLSGEFRARRCEGDTSLLDVAAPDLVHFCARG